MPSWSQSHFLQSLGWATLNSFWQMALLWCLFAAANCVFKPVPNGKYNIAILSIFLGFSWFIATAVLFYQNAATSYTFFENTLTHSNSLLRICLFSASITYLVLLVFPTIRLFKNWRFVQLIKKEGLEKAAPEYRLFVQKIASYLNINKKVKVAVSRFVSSPLTIGYLKPIILLPIATLNNLTANQVEAILLHELAHIRRYDYLVNLLVSIIHTLLYFNPFVKLFVRIVESERETCCDELVLQFGYDKVGYASALLHLEKGTSQHPLLTLGATGKKNLLTRIEKIVGMKKKKTFQLVQMVPLFAALVCILLFNSVLIIKDAEKGANFSYAYENIFVPLQMNSVTPHGKLPADKDFYKVKQNIAATPSTEMSIDIFNGTAENEVSHQQTPAQSNPSLTPVNFDEVDGNLSKEEKENVSTTVAATKKVLSTVQWKEIETSMAEVLDKKEKAVAKQNYLQELENVNWKNIEQNLKVNYDQLDWNTINSNVAKAMNEVKLDSLQTIFAQALNELEKMEKELKGKVKTSLTPMPDASVEELKIAKVTLRNNLDCLKKMRPKKIVRL